MLVEVNSIDLVIIDTTGLSREAVATWKDLCSARSCVFVSDAETYEEMRRQAGKVGVFKRRQGIPAEAATIKAILRERDLQPFQAVYVTHNADRMAEVLPNTHVGTILVAEEAGPVWPDFIASSVSFVAEVLARYGPTQIGYLGEVIAHRPTPQSWACCIGFPRLAPDLDLPSDTHVIALGRFFAKGDSRSLKHEYTRRLLWAKTRKDSMLARALATFLLQWAADNPPDIVTALPGRDGLVDTVRTACAMADAESFRPGFSWLDRFAYPLLRALPRQPQKTLSKAERIQNVVGKFPPAVRLRGSPHVMLVDDIVTTGATMIEAAKSLLAAGAGKVTGVALAHDQRGIEAPWGSPLLKCTCGGTRLVRFNGSHHGAFWGCSNYPKCKETLPYGVGLSQLNSQNSRDAIFVVRDVPL